MGVSAIYGRHNITAAASVRFRDIAAASLLSAMGAKGDIKIDALIALAIDHYILWRFVAVLVW